MKLLFPAKKSRNNKSRQTNRQRRRLQIESLEARQLLTTFTPTDVASLKAAISTANTNGEADTIDLGGNTFTLTSVDNGSTGLPVIAGDSGNSLTIANGTIERQLGSPNFRIIHSVAADLTLDGVTIANGKADNGANILAGFDGSLSVVGSTITGAVNSSLTGGLQGGQGIETYANAVLQLINSTVSGNDGDGVKLGYLPGAEHSIVNSTISGNGSSGVSVLEDSSVSIRNSTVSGNQTGIVTEGASKSGPGGAVDIRNSIVTGSSIIDFDDNAGASTGSNNLSDDGSVPGTIGSVTNLDPVLANNGGPTLTHALLPGSNAIDAGNNSLLPADTLDLDGDGNTSEAVPFDQRGLDRIANGTVDIGAVEVAATGGNQDPVVAADSGAVSADEGDTAANTGTFSDPDGDTVTLSASIGTVVDAGGGAWAWSFDTNDGPDDSATVTITATDSNGGTATVDFALTVNNVAPTVAVDNAVVTVTEGDTAANSGTYADPGVDGITLSASIGAVVDNNDGTYSWSVDSTGLSDQTVTITGTDSDGAVSNVASFQLVVEPAVVGVDVDVKPGNAQNKVNAKSQGVIPVAILTDGDFDASTVDGSTVQLAGVSADHYALEDVDNDGDLDLILHFDTQDVLDALGLDLDSGDEVDVDATLTGETVDQVMIEGIDSIHFFLKGKKK